MTAEEMKRLHEDYRQSVEASRKPDSEEAAAKASSDMIDLRRQLDDALIENEQEREDEARMAAVEAREKAAKIVASVEHAAPAPRYDLPEAELRDFSEGKTNVLKTNIALPSMTEMRADTIDETGTSGGHYVVPSSMASRVVMQQLAQSGVLRAKPTILNTDNAQVLNIPTLTTDLTSLAGTQGAASTVTNPVWASVDLSAMRVDGHALVADELFRDSGVNMNTMLGDLAGRSLGKFDADYLADFEIGTGSSLPNAVSLFSTASTATASSATVTLDEMKAFFYGVLPQYRANGSWVMLTDLWLIMALAKDDDGNYLIQPSNMASEPDRLFGRPVYEDAYMSSMASANRVAVFGDIGAGYWVRFSGGLEVSFSRDFEFTSFSTTVRWAVWLDAVTVDAAAIHHLLLAT